MLMAIVILLVSIFFLWIGADWFIESSSYFAKKLHISELVIGLTVVAFGTSAPEFAVSVGAALKGHSAISIANIVGSDIFNLGFILGIVALFHTLPVEHKLLRRDGLFLLFISVALLFVFRDHKFSRPEGFLFLALFFAYLLVLFFSKGKFYPEMRVKELGWKSVPMFLIGLALILVGSHYLVDSASQIARALGVSEWLIGVTVVAAGTSTPELATSLVASFKGRPSLSIGNLIGSDIFNIAGVLGMAAALHPMTLSPAYGTSLYLLVGMIVLLLFFMRTQWKLTRWEGAVLILFGLFRWLVNIF